MHNELDIVRLDVRCSTPCAWHDCSASESCRIQFTISCSLNATPLFDATLMRCASVPPAQYSMTMQKSCLSKKWSTYDTILALRSIDMRLASFIAARRSVSEDNSIFLSTRVESGSDARTHLKLNSQE